MTNATSEDGILANVVHLPNTVIGAIVHQAAPHNFLDLPLLKRFEYSYKKTLERIADAILEVACEDAWRSAVYLFPDGDVLATDPSNFRRLVEGEDCLLVAAPMTCCLGPGLRDAPEDVAKVLARAKDLLDESYQRAREQHGS